MKFLSVRSDICRQLPSDSTSRWTPLPLTMQFPLLGLARDFHPLDNAHAERTSKNASILRKYGSICMGEKPRLFYNITEDVKARKANAFENFPAFDLIAFIVVVFYERNSDNGLICIPIVYKPFEIG